MIARLVNYGELFGLERAAFRNDPERKSRLYIIIKYPNTEARVIYDDAITSTSEDINWIVKEINEAYERGILEGMKKFCSKLKRAFKHHTAKS